MAAGPIGSVWAAGSWADDCWEADTWADLASGTLPFTGDLNTRLLQFLRDHYSTNSSDLTTLATKYMDSLTSGDRNQKWKQMEQDAHDAMS